ncbi:MAG: DUF547 domain-containing protein [Nodosilinea sp.]
MLNFVPWDSMLQEYVDDQGRVDYGHWQQEARDTLGQWLSDLGGVEVDTLSSEEKLALLLNLYNALTIQQVLKQYPLVSIRPRVLGVPNWLGLLQFFSRPIYILDGEALSLQAIEHQKLRPVFKEPRIHFALVCASLGCPILRNEAYLPDIVEAQLETDAHRFIHNPDKVRYDPETGTLYLSKIFKWYAQDFLKVAPSVPDYIGAYLSTPATLSAATKVFYLPYDWALNQRTSS